MRTTLAEAVSGAALVLCLLLAATTAQAQTPPVDAARTGLSAMLARLPQDDAAAYGFPAGTDPSAVTLLGEPLRLKTITPTALASYAQGQPLEALLSDTRLWYFPVGVNGSIAAMLVVDVVDGEYQAVSLGYAGLAAALAAPLERHASGQTEMPQLVAVFQAKEFFLSLPVSAPGRLVSLRPGQGAQGTAAPSLAEALQDERSDLSAVVGRLLPVVQDNLRQGY